MRSEKLAQSKFYVCVLIYLAQPGPFDVIHIHVQIAHNGKCSWTTCRMWLAGTLVIYFIVCDYLMSFLRRKWAKESGHLLECRSHARKIENQTVHNAHE